MSLRYKGAVLSTVPPTTNTTVAPGIWTLEQQYLAQGGSAWPEVPYPNVFQNVSLLLTGDGTNGAQNNTFLDSSTNNYTITRSVGAATQGTFSPYGTLWSNYFDDTSSLSTPNQTAFNFGTGNFTVEAWVYPTGVATTYGRQVVGKSNGSSGWALLVNRTINGDYGIVATNASGTALVVNTTSLLPLHQWAHIAWVRSSGTAKLYLNGVEVASAADTSNDTNTNTLWIASQANNGANQNFPGYISNLRIVKGTAVYTSNFTPSTTPLTAVSGTSLLTCQSNRFLDSSANNFVITPTGSPAVQRFSPFKPTSAYDAATIGASGSFSGSDVLSAGTGTNFDLGSGDFCMESWFYSINGANAGLICKRQSFNAGGWAFGALRFSAVVGTTWRDPVVGASGSTCKKGEWTHVVVTRSGNDFRYFTNGVLTSYTSYSGAIQQMTAHNLVFGNAGTTIEGPLTGYMTDSRLTIGSIPAAYQTSSTTTNTQIFTPPTSPIASSTGTILLKYQNSGIPDSAMINDIQTVGNAQVSTSIKKYGTGSLYFNGTTDYLSIADNPNFEFGSGNFTVEAWVYLTGYAANASGSYASCLLDKDSAASNSRAFSFAIQGTASSWTGIYMLLGNSSGALQSVSGSVSLSLNTWYYITYTRSNGVGYVFVNGTLLNSGTLTTDIVNTTVPVLVGAGGYSGYPYRLPGYVDDLRVTKGIALYTGSFTPPTKALPTY